MINSPQPVESSFAFLFCHRSQDPKHIISFQANVRPPAMLCCCADSPPASSPIVSSAATASVTCARIFEHAKGSKPSRCTPPVFQVDVGPVRQLVSVLYGNREPIQVSRFSSPKKQTKSSETTLRHCSWPATADCARQVHLDLLPLSNAKDGYTCKFISTLAGSASSG